MTVIQKTSNLPLRIGITGGISSGKSYICKQLQNAGFAIFYCDDVAKNIIRTHPIVKQQLSHLVGKDLYNEHGALVKKVLATYLCKGTDHSHKVDAIVHPQVAEAFKTFCWQKVLNATSHAHPLCFSTENKQITLASLLTLPKESTVFMECALLFESGFDKLVDHKVLVHVSHKTQVERLMNRDHITHEQALKWINLQLSEDEKMQRADAYILNE